MSDSHFETNHTELITILVSAILILIIFNKQTLSFDTENR